MLEQQPTSHLNAGINESELRSWMRWPTAPSVRQPLACMTCGLKSNFEAAKSKTSLRNPEPWKSCPRSIGWLWVTLGSCLTGKRFTAEKLSAVTTGAIKIRFCKLPFCFLFFSRRAPVRSPQVHMVPMPCHSYKGAIKEWTATCGTLPSLPTWSSLPDKKRSSYPRGNLTGLLHRQAALPLGGRAFLFILWPWYIEPQKGT